MPASAAGCTQGGARARRRRGRRTEDRSWACCGWAAHCPEMIAELTAVAARRCRPYLKGLVSSRPGDEHPPNMVEQRAKVLYWFGKIQTRSRCEASSTAFRTFDCVCSSANNGCCPGQLWSNFHCRASKASLMIIDFHTHVARAGRTPGPVHRRQVSHRRRCAPRSCGSEHRRERVWRPPRSAASISL